MEMYSKMKILFLILAVCIAFAVVFAEIIITLEIINNSKNVKCLIKKEKDLKSIIKTIKQAIIGFCLAALLIFFNHNIIKYVKFKYYYISPFILKVRINS